MRILLTGANGFLGSHLLHKLFQDHDVSIILRKNSNIQRISSILQSNKIDILYIDSTNNTSIESFFKNKNFELIIHCATNYDRKNHYFFDVFESNVLFPLKLLEIGLHNGLQYFINTDSYFNKENLTYNALPNYSKTKKLFLHYLQEVGQSISIINMRLEHIYGPNDNDDKFIPFLYNKLIKNAPIPLTYGHQKRDFVYIDDVINTFIKIINNLRMTKHSYFKTLEIGSGKSIYLKKFIETMASMLNSTSELQYGKIDYRDDEIMNSFANASLTKWSEEYEVNFTFCTPSEGIHKMLSSK